MYALGTISMDNILHFTNTLIIMIVCVFLGENMLLTLLFLTCITLLLLLSFVVDLSRKA